MKPEAPSARRVGRATWNGHSKKGKIMLYITDRLFSGIAAVVISGVLLAAAIV